MLPNLLLVILLCTAQAGIALHGAEHDAQTAQSSLCASCVAADHLSSASIDVQSDGVPAVDSGFASSPAGRTCPSNRTDHADPRGPPAAA